MLQKSFRLKSPRLFKYTLQGKRLGSNNLFVMYGLERSAQTTLQSTWDPPRFGLIVSKKIHKRAVRRNRIKRRLREAIRTGLLMTSRADQLSGYSAFVIIARSGSLEATYQEIYSKLIGCFQ